MDTIAITPYRHIVMFKLYEEVNEETIEKAINLLKEMGKEAVGVLQWHVDLSLDTRKGKIIVQNCLFDSFQSFENFLTAPKHLQSKEMMRDISDWIVGDYYE
jgi:hypothetical protein